ncbi:hypothetical protein B0H10DRAFT_2200034 [Mycena sp. CBHHK59/15]|nr:hypothetical protein B0H10DRAFT_2200034 [Mycena sp. CBHHK59/15]
MVGLVSLSAVVFVLGLVLVVGVKSEVVMRGKRHSLVFPFSLTTRTTSQHSRVWLTNLDCDFGKLIASSPGRWSSRTPYKAGHKPRENYPETRRRVYFSNRHRRCVVGSLEEILVCPSTHPRDRNFRSPDKHMDVRSDKRPFVWIPYDSGLEFSARAPLILNLTE